MLKTIKTGFGLTLGFMIGTIAVDLCKEAIMRWGADDDEFMEYEKEHNPKMYEQLKKHRTK